MTGMGEWGDEGQPSPGSESANPWLAQAVARSAEGVDVGAMASALVDKTVHTLIAKKVAEIADPIVAAAIEDVFTAERQAELADAAGAAAQEALSPAASAPDAEQTDTDSEAPQLYYGSIDEFVREIIVPVFMRRVGPEGERRWCARWWESTEAIMRLEALWRSWEHLRLDPGTGMSVWLRDHLDHHLVALMDPDGPFATSQDKSRPGQMLPYDPPPLGMFTDERTTAR